MLVIYARLPARFGDTAYGVLLAANNAGIKDMSGFAYVNDGDWVESCAALVEYQPGELGILCWAGENERTRPARLPIPIKAAA